MSVRNSLMAAAALLALTAAAPAYAQNSSSGDTNIENFVRQQPGTPPVSNGIPKIVGNRDGQPVIEYQGARPGVGGMQDGRVPRIVDNRDGGDPQIRYGNGGPPPRAAMRGRSSRMADAMPADTGSPAYIGMLLNRAQSSIQQGRYGAASATLEEAETRLLNSRADGTNGHSATLQAVSEARAAANKRDRSGAMQSLGSARQAMRS